MIKATYTIKKIIRKLLAAPFYLFAIAVVKMPFFDSYKKKMLSKWYLPIKGVEKILFYPVFAMWIKLDYLREKDPDKRETLKELAMGKDSGREWAKYYDSQPLDFDSKVGHLTLQEANPLYKTVEAILSANKSLIVIQVGSSSGREIAYLASKYLSHIFIGTDIYKEVIDYSASRHKLENLSFRLLSAKDISGILPEHRDDRILIFSSGSLQYVQPKHVEAFFNSISGHNVKMVLTEPGNESKGCPDKLNGSLWRDNFSYTHDYKFYAEKAGLETIEYKIIRPYYPYTNKEFLPHKDTIHYYWYGKTNTCKY